MTVIVVCAHCGAEFASAASAVNRSRTRGMRSFCSRRCFGLDRRIERPDTEQKRLKAAYDRRYRAALAEELAAKKHEYFKRTYDPAKAREQRKGRMAQHVAYCRRYYADPVRRQEKFQYDVRRRGAAYADFAEAWRLLIELEREIRQRCPDKYERQKARGYFTRIQERKYRERQDRRTA